MKNTNKRPTIFDLVKITGYSTATISRAFNAKTRISSGTRDFILKKAREIGYFPHSGARSMTQGRTGRWGLLLPHLHNPRYAEIMDQLDLEAQKNNSLFLLGLTRYNPQIESHLVNHWAAGEVDGIIAGSWLSKEIYEQLYHRKYPLVFLFGSPGEQFNLVSNDPTVCFDSLLNEAWKQGHRRFAYISHSFPDCRIHNSYESFHRILTAKGAYTEDFVFFGESDESAAADAWKKMKAMKKAPTVVMCFNDFIASNLMTLARREGLKIPEDLSVLGSDDIPRAESAGLTTVRMEPEKIASAAFQLLLDPIKRKGQKVVVPTTIVDRKSIGSPRRRHTLLVRK